LWACSWKDEEKELWQRSSLRSAQKKISRGAGRHILPAKSKPQKGIEAERISIHHAKTIRTRLRALRELDNVDAVFQGLRHAYF